MPGSGVTDTKHAIATGVVGFGSQDLSKIVAAVQEILT